MLCDMQINWIKLYSLNSLFTYLAQNYIYPDREFAACKGGLMYLTKLRQFSTAYKSIDRGKLPSICGK